MFIVEGSRAGRPYELPVVELHEAVRAAAWALCDRAFAPRRILSAGGRVLIDERRLMPLIGELIASGEPLI